jgi:hypothetical protein
MKTHDDCIKTASACVQYSEVTSWAEIFADAPVDVRKMIVLQLICDFKVSRDYPIDIDFRISAKELELEYDAPFPKKTKISSRNVVITGKELSKLLNNALLNCFCIVTLTVQAVYNRFLCKN